MTEELFLDRIKSVRCRRPGALLARRSMLVLDAFRGHLTHGVKKKLVDEWTELVVIPGDIRIQLKPLHFCLEPFKAQARWPYNT